MRTLGDRGGRPLIDCDIHNEPALESLQAHLPDHWVDYTSHSGFRGPDASDYPPGLPLTARPDFRGGDGPPGSTLAQVRGHVLDAWELEHGVLTCNYQASSVHNADLGAALAAAVNTWQIEEWLQPEPRLRASVVVPSQDPVLAAAEIDRLGGVPGSCR